jgi:flagellar FliL protein
MPETTEKPDVSAQPEAPKVKLGGGLDITQLLIKVSVIAAIALVAILAAFIVTTKVLKPMLANEPPTAEELAAAVQEEEQQLDESHDAVEKNVEKNVEESSEKSGEESGEEHMFEIEQIIVNPAGTIGSRFLSCSVAFEIESEKDLSVFEKKEIKIRDALISVLTARTVDELADPRLREPLRRQILARVNKLTEPATASAVYFKDFVLQ